MKIAAVSCAENGELFSYPFNGPQSSVSVSYCRFCFKIYIHPRYI